MSRQQPHPSGWRLVKPAQLKPSSSLVLAVPTSSTPVSPTHALQQELEAMEARLRDLNGIFEHIHEFHSWLSKSSHQLSVDVQKVDPRVRGSVQPPYGFDSLSPRVPPGFIPSLTPGPMRSRNPRFLRLNQLRADQCEKRLSQTRVEYRHSQYQLQVARGLVSNLQIHRENETKHVLNQMCLAIAQPISLVPIEKLTVIEKQK